MERIIIRNVSSPIPAGKLAVITGDNLDLQNLTVELLPIKSHASDDPVDAVKTEGVIKVQPVSGADGHTVTFRMPEEKNAAYMVRVKIGEEESNLWPANVPQIDWLSLDKVASGETLRAMGKGLVSVDRYPKGTKETPGSFGGYLEDHKVTVCIKDRTGKAYAAEVTKASSYDVRFTVPELPDGEYTAYVHNGTAWSNGFSFAVEAKKAWPQDVFNVLDYGAKPVEVRDVYYVDMIDSAPGFQKALDAAGANGGGIVYVPNGRYCFKSELRIPKYTVLRGEDQKRVWLELPKGVADKDGNGTEDGWGTPEEGMKIKVFIGGETDFGIENINILAVYNPVIIAAPVVDPLPALAYNDKYDSSYGYSNVIDGTKFAQNVFIRNCFIVHEPSFFAQRKTNDDPVFKDEKWDGQHKESKLFHWAAIVLRGDHCVIEKNEIKGAGNPIVLLAHQYTRVSENLLHNGSYTSHIVMWSSSYNPSLHWYRHNKCIIIEDNTFTVATNLNRSASWIMESHSHFYLARNVIKPMFWPSDCEGLNFHTWGTHYVVSLAGKGNETITVNRADVKEVYDTRAASHGIFCVDGTLIPGKLKGFEICTIGGKGMGQYRNVVDNTEDTITLDAPWDTDLDDTTVINIGEFPKFHFTVFTDNFIDACGRALYYWGSAYESVMDGNIARRNSGIIMEDLSKHYEEYASWQFAGHYYNQIINNKLTEPRGFCSNYGIIGVSGGRVAHSTVSMIIRGNIGEDDAIISACPRGAAPDGLNYHGVVLEDNHSKNCDIGIEIHENVECVLSGNTFENCDRPVVGKGKYTVEL